MDFDKLMKLDLSYPGISFGYRSWSLGIYLETLNDFTRNAGDQYRLKARQHLKERVGELHDEEYIQELIHIDEAADKHIPSYARMSAIVLIWGIFESTVSDIARYVAQRENISLMLNDIRANGFIDQTCKYFENVLTIELPWTDSEINSARHLKKIRNAIAHRNGQFVDESTKRIREMNNVIKQVSGVDFSSSHLIISHEYVTSSTKLVFSMIEGLDAVIQVRYDGPAI